MNKDIAGKVYQFRIDLEHIKPPIWRRIQVPEYFTMYDLNIAILNAMGWHGGHLHGFHELYNTRVGPREVKHVVLYVDDMFNHDGNDYRMWEEKMADWFVLGEREKMKHQYDYGDGWEHMVVLEKVLDVEAGVEYPKCVKGKRACPPDDCGGVGGYMDMLDTMKSGAGSDWQEEQLEWIEECGCGGWDAERFVIEEDVDFWDKREKERYLEQVQGSSF